MVNYKALNTLTVLVRELYTKFFFFEDTNK